MAWAVSTVAPWARNAVVAYPSSTCAAAYSAGSTTVGPPPGRRTVSEPSSPRWVTIQVSPFFTHPAPTVRWRLLRRVTTRSPTPATSPSCRPVPSGVDPAGGDQVGAGAVVEGADGGPVPGDQQAGAPVVGVGGPRRVRGLDHPVMLALAQPVVGGVLADDAGVADPQPGGRGPFPLVGEPAGGAEFGHARAAVAHQQGERRRRRRWRTVGPSPRPAAASRRPPPRRRRSGPGPPCPPATLHPG